MEKINKKDLIKTLEYFYNLLMGIFRFLGVIAILTIICAFYEYSWFITVLAILYGLRFVYREFDIDYFVEKYKNNKRNNK